jgi:hypothetical protein
VSLCSLPCFCVPSVFLCSLSVSLCSLPCFCVPLSVSLCSLPCFCVLCVHIVYEIGKPI